MDNRFLTITDYQYRIKALEEELRSFRSGQRYQKLQEDQRKVTAGFIKEIRRLRGEVADANARAVSARDLWFGECVSDWEEYQKELEKKEKEIRQLKERIWEAVRSGDERLEKAERQFKERLSEKDAEIEALKALVAHYEAVLARDSTNTGTPTGQTPPGKNRHVPNSRRSSGRAKGGQPGHPKHELEPPPEDAINSWEEHRLEEGDSCPACGSTNLRFTGEYEDRYEVDVRVEVIKRRHRYWMYECMGCGTTVYSSEGPGLSARCVYGPNVQAFSLSLMNTANAAMNKVPVILSGMTFGECSPCEGYMAKLQKRAAQGLEGFWNGLSALLATRLLVYWDDTVVMADRKRICLRFYGDETIAIYAAHEKKDMAGVIEDGILDMLSEMARVMHDHNSISYNARFVFLNIECNAHLQRDLQKSADETGHAELLEMKELISRTIKDRNDLRSEGKARFPEEYVRRFNGQLDDILERAETTAGENESPYSGQFERALVRRVKEYRTNYFAWVADFSIPTTNNLAERALRGVKTKMKVSGQFASVETANCYARIRTYTETCRRNRINEMEALSRLCQGKPYTVEEIFPT